MVQKNAKTLAKISAKTPVTKINDKNTFEPTEWDLDALLSPWKSKSNDALIAQLRVHVDAFVKRRMQLTDTITAQTFKSLVEQIDEISSLLEKLGAHANFCYSKNVKDQHAKAYLSFVDELGAELINKLLFFELWYVKLPQSKARELAESLDVDSHTFIKKYEDGKHMLSESEEKIINLKDITGAAAHAKLYNTIVSGWSFNFERKRQSLTQLKNFLHNPNRKKRKEADILIEHKYREYEDVLGDIYVALTRDYCTEQVQLRKYESPLAVRAQHEEVSLAAINSLFDAVRSRREVFHEFFALRAKLLGLKKLETYDLLAPIGNGVHTKIPYTTAMRQVISAIEQISPQFRQKIEILIAQRHVDSVFHPNKMGGAYNYGLAHKILPYVFMQYLGDRYDKYTIMHEFGHAVHSMHLNSYSAFSAHSTIGIAESVSTFFEEILFEQELTQATDKKKIELLAWKMSDLFSSISNGAYVSYFETLAHDCITKGGTHQDVSKIWTRLKKEQLGSAVHTRDSLIGWLSIPHIFEMPFYYYNYAVGNLIALLLLKQFKTNPIRFRERFVRYLSAGGTMSTVDTLKLMDIDIEDKKTWIAGLALLRERVSLLKFLVAKSKGNI